MFDRKGILAEALVTREENEVSIVRVTAFKTSVEAMMYEKRMVALIEAEFIAQGEEYQHITTEIDHE